MEQDNDTRIRRSILRFAQAAHTLFEQKAPRSLGIPSAGMAVLRLLHAEGPQSATVLAQVLELTRERLTVTVQSMADHDWVRCRKQRDRHGEEVYAITGEGTAVMQQVSERQTMEAVTAVRSLDAADQELVATILDQMTRELTAESGSFNTLCAQCWAYDPRNCAEFGADERCALQVQEAAHLQPA